LKEKSDPVDPDRSIIDPDRCGHSCRDMCNSVISTRCFSRKKKRVSKSEMQGAVCKPDFYSKAIILGEVDCPSPCPLKLSSSPTRMRARVIYG